MGLDSSRLPVPVMDHLTRREKGFGALVLIAVALCAALEAVLTG